MLISSFGQSGYDWLSIYGSYPSGHGLYPCAVENTTHIGHIHKGRRENALDSGAVQHGRFHLGKASEGLTKHEHDIGDTLVGDQSQGRSVHSQGIVLAGVQVVYQSAVFAAVHLIGNFVCARGISFLPHLPKICP